MTSAFRDHQHNPFLAPNPRTDFFPYETIDYAAELEVLDRRWTTACFTRRQRIRFLDDGVATFFDRVWGDGVLFANYAAHSMRLIDAIRGRSGYVVVLALPKTFNKHQEFEVITERKLVGAFFDELNYWESTLQHPAERLSLDIIAPAGASFRDPAVWAPPKRQVTAAIKGRTFQLRVQRPSVNVPYKLTWLRK